MPPEDCGSFEDAQLVAQCQGGGGCRRIRSGGHKIPHQVYAKIYNLARNEEEAGDLAQETDGA